MIEPASTLNPDYLRRNRVDKARAALRGKVLMMSRPAGARYAFVVTANGMCEGVPVRWKAPELLMVNPDLNLPPATAHLRTFGAEPARLLAMVLRTGTPDHLTPRQLEVLVATLFDLGGFDAYVTPRSRDGGRDVIAVSRLRERWVTVIAEAKKKALVPPGDVQRLEAVRRRDRASGAMMVTTGRFSKQTMEEVRQNWHRTIDLVDGEELVRRARAIAEASVATPSTPA
jgi:hypothetical protein